MRIVAGRFRGRKLVTPHGKSTRPTTDRVREALFSALASRLGSDLGAPRALDAFAGSGALGLEALSRGASSVTFVESDRGAIGAIRKNVEALGVRGRTELLAVDAFSLPKRHDLGAPFSLLLLDPPYRIPSAEVAGLLSTLEAQGVFTAGCLVTWEHSSAVEVMWPEGFSAVWSKRYGEVAIDVAEVGTGAHRS
jgi:16S rRNA (guanine966-N2)-methyltransferase